MLRVPFFLLIVTLFFAACGNGETPPAAQPGPGDAATGQPADGQYRPITVEPGADSKSAPQAQPEMDPREKFKKTVEMKVKSVDPEERMGAIEMVMEDSDKAFGTDVLVKLMSDESEDVRALAAEAMGMGKFAAGSAALKNAASTDEDALVRSKCLKSLVDLTGKAAVPELVRALGKDDEASVRSQAASLLGATGSDLGIDPLIKALQEDFDEAVRVASLSSLKTLKPARCFDAVVESLQDRNASVRSEAAQLLAELGNKKAVRPLMDALEGEEVGRILQDITDALSKLTGVENEYKTDLSAEDQEEALQLWRDWWEENKGEY